MNKHCEMQSYSSFPLVYNHLRPLALELADEKPSGGLVIARLLIVELELTIENLALREVRSPFFLAASAALVL